VTAVKTRLHSIRTIEVIGVAVSSQPRDRLERTLRGLRAEYIDKVDGDVLARTLREIEVHAERLGLLNKPHLVEQAAREVLGDHLLTPSSRD
jgi:hypothetical protein